MRKIFFSYLVVLFVISCNQADNKQTDSRNENTDYLISMDGIGAVKTDMTQQELEKLLDEKIPLTNPTDTVSGSWQDSAVIKYKDVVLRLGFVRTYDRQDSFHMRVTGMETASHLCETENGIGIGASKQQIIDAFEKYMLIMQHDYDNPEDTVRSKNLYLIKIREDWEGRQIIFYLKDNKVYNIGVGSFYDDSE